MARTARAKVPKPTKANGTRTSKGSRIADTFGKMANTKVEGIGKYAKQPLTKGGIFGSNKESKGLTRRQAYKLEQNALGAQKMAISTKPEMIRAIGQAVAMNTTGAQTGVAAGVASKIGNTNANKTSVTINDLVKGGADITNKNNAEEEEEESFSSLPEYIVR